MNFVGAYEKHFVWELLWINIISLSSITSLHFPSLSLHQLRDEETFTTKLEKGNAIISNSVRVEVTTLPLPLPPQFDCLNDWLIEWMNDGLNDWLIEWLTDWLDETGFDRVPLYFLFFIFPEFLDDDKWIQLVSHFSSLLILLPFSRNCCVLIKFYLIDNFQFKE